MTDAHNCLRCDRATIAVGNERTLFAKEAHTLPIKCTLGHWIGWRSGRGFRRDTGSCPEFREANL